MKIRIIIPVFRSQGFLPRCLSALPAALGILPAEQVECVVVDNGFNPNLAQELSNFEVKCLSAQDFHSAAYARNCGAAGFVDGILVFIDHDVICEPGCIERLVVPIIVGQADGCIGNYSTSTQGLAFGQTYKQLYIHHIYSRKDGLARNDFWTAISAVAARVFHHLQGFDTRFMGANGEDQEFGIRLTQQGYKVLTVGSAMGQHLNPYTAWGIIKNDYKKGVRAVCNSLENAVPLSDNRHASNHDKIAVLSSVFFVFFLILMPFMIVALWSALLFALAWLACRRQLLGVYFKAQSLTFFFASLGLMLVLDWVRFACIVVGFTKGTRHRKHFAAVDPLKSNLPIIHKNSFSETNDHLQYLSEEKAKK